MTTTPTERSALFALALALFVALVWLSTRDEVKDRRWLASRDACTARGGHFLREHWAWGCYRPDDATPALPERAPVLELTRGAAPTSRSTPNTERAP